MLKKKMLKKYILSNSNMVVVPGYGRVRRGQIVEGNLDYLVEAKVLTEVPGENEATLLIEPAPLPIDVVPEDKPKKEKRKEDEDMEANKPKLLTEVEPLPTDEISEKAPRKVTKPRSKRTSRRKTSK